MTSASGACAALLGALAVAFVPAGIGQHAPATRLSAPATVAAAVTAADPGYPDLRAALPRSLAASGQAIRNISSAGSLNWAGYVLSRRTAAFRSVRATFFVPYLNCTASPGTTLSSAWVGLDGYASTSRSVEQIGIGADCSASRAASYFGWFEMFPFAESKLAMKIRPGDSVTVAVTYSAAHRDFRLSLTDTTRGEHAGHVRRCPAVKVSGKRVTCPRTSAEIIAEAPETSSGKQLRIAPLSDYGALSFTGIAVTEGAAKTGGIVSSRWSATKIIQLRAAGGPVLAQPTGIAGGRFDVYWLRED